MDQEVQFLLYNMPEDSGKVQVVIKDETIWCTPKAMAQLFGVGVPAVSKHLKNIFEEGELIADSVISKMETTAADDSKEFAPSGQANAVSGSRLRTSTPSAA